MKISIITVCFNSAAHIADAIDSIDAQQLPAGTTLEHVVVDGGSGDATLAILGERERPWRLVRSEPDKGIYDAMNKGLARASGDVIGFLNSDDFLGSPDVLATIASAFADPQLDAVYGDLCYVQPLDRDRIVRYWRSSPFHSGMFSKSWAPPHPTLYVRRAVYERFGGFDLAYSLAADLELMARFLEVHRVRSLHLPRVLVHMRTGGATNRSLRNVIRQNREIWLALQHHRLAASLPGFVLRKLIDRSRQFFTRPRP